MPSSLLNLLAGSFCYNGVNGGWPLQLSRVPVADVAMNIWLWLGPFHLGALVSAATSEAAPMISWGAAGRWAMESMVVDGGVSSRLSLTTASALFMALVLARSQLRGG